MLVAGSEVPLAEIERIEQELAAKEELLASLEVEAAHLGATRDADLLRLGPDDFASRRRAVRRLPCRRSSRRSPAVGARRCARRSRRRPRNAAVFALAAVDDAQVIVVTDDEVVARRMSDAGGTIVRWPAPEEQRNRGISG